MSLENVKIKTNNSVCMQDQNIDNYATSFPKSAHVN